jgi:hypothetical protein
VRPPQGRLLGRRLLGKSRWRLIFSPDSPGLRQAVSAKRGCRNANRLKGCSGAERAWAGCWGELSRPNRTYLAPRQYLPHGKETEAPKWNVYKIASKAVRLGEVEAPDEAAAMERAAAEFKAPANRLM